jgi:competence protein ComEC
MLCITIAAQIATLPLILFYFHQFPLFFLPANLIMVPGTSLLLYLGILLLLTGWYVPVSEFLGMVIYNILKLLHLLLGTMDGLSFSKIEDIYITTTQTVLLYLLIVFSGCFFVYRKLLLYIISCAVFICLCLSFVLRNHERIYQRSINVYTISQVPVLGFIHGKHISLITTAPISPVLLKQELKTHMAMLGIKRMDIYHCQDLSGCPVATHHYNKNILLVWEGKIIAIYQNKGLKSLEYDLIVCPYKNTGLLPALENVHCSRLMLNIPVKKYSRPEVTEQLKKLNLRDHNIASQGTFTMEF